MNPNYEGWWEGKMLKAPGMTEFKRCVRVEWIGPPSRVYGFVRLHFEDGTDYTVSQSHTYRPRKKDVEVLLSPDDKGEK